MHENSRRLRKFLSRTRSSHSVLLKTSQRKKDDGRGQMLRIESGATAATGASSLHALLSRVEDAGGKILSRRSKYTLTVSRSECVHLVLLEDFWFWGEQRSERYPRITSRRNAYPGNSRDSKWQTEPLDIFHRRIFRVPSHTWRVIKQSQPARKSRLCHLGIPSRAARGCNGQVNKWLLIAA